MHPKKIVKRPNKMTVSVPIKSSAYDTDFYKWIGKQADLLKNREFKKIDIDNLIEEIESLGKSDKRALKSHLINLLTHLLKIEYQPDGKGNSISWHASVKNSKLEIGLILEDSPSLKNELKKMLESSYELACERASIETKLSQEKFPSVCPWKLAQILS